MCVIYLKNLITCIFNFIFLECPLVEFGTGATASKVPFVFIPLSGQIVHPSKEINFKGDLFVVI